MGGFDRHHPAAVVVVFAEAATHCDDRTSTHAFWCRVLAGWRQLVLSAGTGTTRADLLSRRYTGREYMMIGLIVVPVAGRGLARDSRRIFGASSQWPINAPARNHAGEVPSCAGESSAVRILGPDWLNAMVAVSIVT